MVMLSILRTPFCIKYYMKFTDEHIRNYALPAVIKKGKELHDAQCVTDINSIESHIIAIVTGVEANKVIINSKASDTFVSECTCGFSLGGICEHAVAVLYELNTAKQSNDESVMDTIDVSWAKGTNKTDDEQEIHSDSPMPTPRLYLSEYNGLLTIEIRFAYYTKQSRTRFIEFKRGDSDNYALIPAIDNFIVKIIRSKARENEIVNNLVKHGLRSYQIGFYTPIQDSRFWISETLPLLVEKGYELFGHKNLIKCKIHEKKPEIHITIRSRDDGYICSMTIDFDGIPASLVSIIRSLHASDSMVQLNDGSSGRLPQKMIDLLTRLFSVAEPDLDNDYIFVRQHHVPLLDMLHEIADTCDEDDTFREKCKSLQNFSGIKKRSQPEGFSGVMRPYQIAGYEWIYFLQEFNFGGCLADDMGLGKTIQALALFINEKNSSKTKMPNIVVSPTTVLFNWEREAAKFAPKLLCAKYYGPDRKRKVTSLKYADIILTTYGTLLRDIDTLKNIEFNYVVLDEAQIIKNPYAKIRKAACKLSSKHRLVLTGTPIENNLSELWSIFSFINPQLFGTLNGYKSNILSKIEAGTESRGLEILRKMVFPFILRRLKTQVAKELPPKTESVVYTEMLPRQKLIYDITKEAYLGKILDVVERKGIENAGSQIFEGMLRLRQVCCHPVLIEKNYRGDSGKFQVCDDYIDEILAEEHRILIFSQFEMVLQLIEKRLSKRKIPSQLLTGKTRGRSTVVDCFQKDRSIPVFLITLKTGGLGLNLTAADYVLHIDPWWNPAAEDQASDRAYRIGQTKHVFIYKFITKGSIEERVLRLQKEKKELIKNIIQTDKSFMKRLTIEDIESLFS